MQCVYRVDRVIEGKREKPLALDRDFAEALERFAEVDPADPPDSIKLRKKPEKKGDGEPPPSRVDRKPRDPDR